MRTATKDPTRTAKTNFIEDLLALIEAIKDPNSDSRDLHLKAARLRNKCNSHKKVSAIIRIIHASKQKYRSEEYTLEMMTYLLMIVAGGKAFLKSSERGFLSSISCWKVVGESEEISALMRDILTLDNK
ncbi:TPA: hypothetical protein DDW69_03235 [candidate division CPR2 bacterium]|uniref:Uncharacterized protein n=1 Tax=candidate division CPR2 bacterium GW2011_GWC1_41_48 TaxID=1618344 RepID=A0A0G0WAM4_UNCC2|nr:MAG: hypothetical protein UT47_C0003G0158 [candidate division CPR2 bacterium GW2011_GWC2_39_35]KKR27259.1 MAG: hypothetical protein UT60_C0056G0004 [candidate division CPR2 bacterium GW2011_GWD2_39_7]KKS09097.1 MAG: hypothetical protein UU65_C0003G0152 [candidate division CPR2 bacterium GW2011_GWC1_41_48]OGB73178.1 MAG: hypothetical protein A2Y26_00910 [candidate division CPR2 bacterium GWD2_39_7]HBG81830.1 hypothetical protein [candidate division CPR2 bacterium]